MYTLNCNGRLFVMDSPVVMGIINATPDSFYSGGRDGDIREILHKADRMLQAGAGILDIGGLSTRPGSAAVTEREETDRVVPVISMIKKYFPQAFISVDTYRSGVAKAAFENGADMVNDISAGNMDRDMIPVVAGLNIPYIAMHMQGIPANMQDDPRYDDVALEVLKACADKLLECRNAGIKDVITDPGFGFGKTLEQNYTLLKRLHTFAVLDTPLLAGVSRKSMLYKYLHITPEEALNATSVVNAWALEQGVHILRVHDVREARQVVDLWEMYRAL